MPVTTERRQHQEPSLGRYLADLRGARGMTLRDVEEATDKEVSNAYLSQIETGKISKPSPNVLHALAKAYKADYPELMQRAGYVVPKASATSSGRRARLAALAKEDFTPDEEDLVLKFMTFVKQQRKYRDQKR